jgi:hypothetical protein
LDNSLTKLFEPDFCNEITLNNGKLDFVRYLALLFQYCKENRIDHVAKHYGRKMEEYYVEFIYSSVGKNKSTMFKELPDIFPEKQYQPTIDILQKEINSLGIKTFSSIIDADMYLLGLVHEVVINKKKLDAEKIDSLINDLNSKIIEFKADSSHAKTPSLLKHLRGRLATSFEIYGNNTI